MRNHGSCCVLLASLLLAGCEARPQQAETVRSDDPVDAAPPAAPADTPAAKRVEPGDPECARIVTRQQNVPSASGGAMQMIMVTECLPAERR